MALPLSAQQAPTPAEGCNYGAYYLARGDYARALQALIAVSSSSSSPASTMNLRGIAEMMNHDLAAAVKSFDSALNLEPELVEARFNRGVAFLKSSRYDEAATEFDRVLSSPATTFHGRAAYHRALASEGAGHLPAAAKWLERSIALDDSLDEAFLYLGSVKEKQRDFQGAGRAYQSYLARRPESIVAMLRYGVAAHRSGHYDTARKYLREVTARAPHTAEAMEAAKFLVMWE